MTFDGNGKGLANGLTADTINAQLPVGQTCEKCKKGKYEFDESVEEYFAFLE